VPTLPASAAGDTPKKHTGTAEKEKQAEQINTVIHQEPTQMSEERSNEVTASASPSAAEVDVQLSSTKKRGRPLGSAKKVKKQRLADHQDDSLDTGTGSDLAGSRRRSATPGSRSIASSPPRPVRTASNAGHEEDRISRRLTERPAVAASKAVKETTDKKEFKLYDVQKSFSPAPPLAKSNRQNSSSSPTRQPSPRPVRIQMPRLNSATVAQFKAERHTENRDTGGEEDINKKCETEEEKLDDKESTTSSSSDASGTAEIKTTVASSKKAGNVCDQCSKSFNSQTALLYHVR
jgi:hypothetical protein